MIINWSIAFFVVAVLALSVITHEFGHWLYIYRKRGIKMKFKLYKDKGISNFGLRQFDKSGVLANIPLTPAEMKNTLIMGVMFGFVPVFFGMLALVNVTIIGYFLIPAYLGGCRRDFDKLIQIVKNEMELMNHAGRKDLGR